jgi:hypothetical protein
VPLVVGSIVVPRGGHDALRGTATPYGNDRRTIDESWRRRIPNLDSAKKTGLTDVDRDSDVGSQY